MFNPDYEKEMNIVLDKANNSPTERVEAKIGKVSKQLILDAKTMVLSCLLNIITILMFREQGMR